MHVYICLRLDDRGIYSAQDGDGRKESQDSGADDKRLPEPRRASKIVGDLDENDLVSSNHSEC
jgi:hypothetical protein